MISTSQSRANERHLCPENKVAKRICEVIGQGKPLAFQFAARPAHSPKVGFCVATTQLGRRFGVNWQHAAAVSGDERMPGVQFTVTGKRSGAKNTGYRLAGLISFEDLGIDSEQSAFIEFMGNRMLDAMADKANVTKT